MKKIFCALMLTVMFAFASFVPAQANPIDIKALTCEGLDNLSEEAIEDILIWLAGGVSSSMNSTVFDYTAIGQFGEGFIAVCEKNPKLNMVEALAAYFKSFEKK